MQLESVNSQSSLPKAFIRHKRIQSIWFTAVCACKRDVCHDFILVMTHCHVSMNIVNRVASYLTWWMLPLPFPPLPSPDLHPSSPTPSLLFLKKAFVPFDSELVSHWLRLQVLLSRLLASMENYPLISLDGRCMCVLWVVMGCNSALFSCKQHHGLHP